MKTKNENSEQEGLGEYITIAGLDSKIFRAKQKETQAERLANATIGWSGITLDGEELEFSQDAAKQLYMEHDFIRERVAELIKKGK